MSRIGLSFDAEISAAGLIGKPFSVAPDGTVTDGGLSTADRAKLDAVIAAHDPTRPPPPVSCTKLGLMRAFSELGLWAQVKRFIAADETRQEQWDLATTLKLSDPIVVAAIQAFALSGITIDPVQLATRANELVQ